MYGYMGTILRINLSDGTIKKEPLQQERYRDFIGGRGLNSKILYDEIQPGIDPLGPENRRPSAWLELTVSPSSVYL